MGIQKIRMGLPWFDMVLYYMILSWDNNGFTMVYYGFIWFYDGIMVGLLWFGMVL